MYKSISILLILMVTIVITAYSQLPRFNISTFESVKLHKKGYYNGDDLSGGFKNGHFYYRLNYDSSWKSWSGIAVSNHIDTITNSYTNEFSNITGKGYNNSENFGVCYNSGTIICDSANTLTGFYITNTAYTYNTIKNGSTFSKKFGGTNGNDTDWFRVKIVNYFNGKRMDSLYSYLADFRFADNSKDFILKKWKWVDFSDFKSKTDSLKISFQSTDNGTFGMNTPAYMAFDDFNFSKYSLAFTKITDESVFKTGNVWNGETDTSGGFDIAGFYFVNNYDTKWKSWNGWAISKDKDTSKTGFDAQYSSITANKITLISYGRSIIKYPNEKIGNKSRWFYISNNTYTYKAMKYGDAFSKKFGGNTGTDKDYLKLNMIAYSENGTTDTFVYFLADFRNNQAIIENQDIMAKYIINKDVTRIEFQLESTDNGTFGMNTPAYFCLKGIDWIEDVKSNTYKKVKVYPNPANEYLLIGFANFESYEISDISGKEFTSKTSNYSNKIDIKDLPHGIFLIKIKKDDIVYYSRFVK